jgi:hypothetical protein
VGAIQGGPDKEIEKARRCLGQGIGRLKSWFKLYPIRSQC